MAKSCTICGEDIDAENQPFVTSNRRVYHLDHEDDIHVKQEEYEQIVETLKGQLAFHVREIDEKNKIILNIGTSHDEMQKERGKFKDDYKVLEDQHRKILGERHRCFDELSIYKTDFAKLQKTNTELTAEVADYHKLQADLKEQLENSKDDTKE